ncbi:MAG: GlsB/YeaQ/YmgE family stress response membrane protein [Stappiaceae bacterium]|jgi:uncharacterized membrane protein YeaQ/YmgE (transglycosylase-associated protein family)
MSAGNIAIWIVIGILAGWLASFIVGGSGLVRYLITGLIGSFAGGFLASQFGLRLNLGNEFVDQIVIATGGAIVVVLIARLLA